ncbi:MAG: hypothetical protein WAW91_01520, partial [Candidatus Nanoperiomorbaceae bacterium]
GSASSDPNSPEPNLLTALYQKANSGNGGVNNSGTGTNSGSNSNGSGFTLIAPNTAADTTPIPEGCTKY